MPAGDYPAMLGMIARGELDPGRLVRSVIDLGDAPAALMDMDQLSAGLGMTVISAGA
jgi:threonine dehydrogenase-like Zn-dependent dehydrogenase